MHAPLLLSLLATLACNRHQDDSGTDFLPFEPSVATMHRLTDAQWRNTARVVTGVSYEGPLPADYPLHGYTRVGASEATVSPLELEKYEFAAWEVAWAAIPDPSSVDAFVGCDPDEPACLGTFTETLGSEAWRRPLTPTEVERLSWVYTTVSDRLDSASGARAVIATALLAPDFTFRVELGTAHPSEPTWRRYTDWEMASRLSYVLTDHPPDAELRAAADAGDLSHTAGLQAQAERLLATPEAREVLQDWFAETLELDRLQTMSKDETRFPELTPTLRTAMDTELRTLFDWVVFDQGLPYNTLLTTNTTFVDRELGQLYGKDFSDGGLIESSFLPYDDRGGLLGRAGILAIHAHNTQTSPTLRGRFVRSRLLCQSIPPPPEGVVTELPPPSEGGTLRDRLAQHATDIQCSGCHNLTDPIGFGMEHFDALGRRRELDNNLPIDASGDIDGVAFHGAAALGMAVAEHPELPTCTALSLYRFTNGQAEAEAELGLIDALANDFAAEGQLLDRLVLDLVLSEGFRSARPADGAPSDPPSDEPFEPPAPRDPPEEPPTDEVCNSIDDDGDGLVDEDLEVATLAYSASELHALGHPSCNATADPMSPACYAANHRICANTDCATSGFGPVDETTAGYHTACLDSSEAVVVGTTFTELSSHHDGCTISQRHGPACYAAINRFCGGRGSTTGYGPVENSGDTAVVTCTPSATVYNTTYTTMATLNPVCNGSSQRWGRSCNQAIHHWCVSQGHETGFGPLENWPDGLQVACLGVTP